MAATESAMVDLGTELPDFILDDALGSGTISTADLEEAPALVMFLCQHCPYVQHVEEELGRLGDDYADSDLNIVAISSNDTENYPQDGPRGMREQAQRAGFSFPYLFDEQQEAAQAFEALCTPDFFLFDAHGCLFYRGQLDSSRPGSAIPADGTDLRGAIDALLAGEDAPTGQRPSVGCNVKWKLGNEPS